MTFVVDASIATCWLMPDENDPRAAAAYDRISENDAVAPAIWWFEVRNVIAMNERRGRINVEEADDACAFATRLPVLIDREPNEAAMMTLARRHRLTVYDAAYLELALRRSAPLATLDAALTRAANAEGVTLIGA